MITLDENATAYEPAQNKFQQQTAAGAHGAGAGTVGAAPGAHVDDAAAAAAIPGFGSAAAVGRTMIGGIPRSAIPGLAQSLATTIPANPAAAAAAAAAAGGPAPPHSAAAEQPNQFRAPLPRHKLRAEDAVFPSQWRVGLPMKLPGQTRVSPEEYREFLSLGHGEIFDIELDWVVEPPWRYPGIDPGDFFNYGMNETTWKEYQERVKRFRQEFTLQNQIQTMDVAVGGHKGGMGGGGGGGLRPPFHQRQQDQFEQDQDQEDDGGDKALKSTMGGEKERDEHYEAFVVAERPSRQLWIRYGSLSEHCVVLTGADLEYSLDDTGNENAGEDGGRMGIGKGPPQQYQQYQHQQQIAPFGDGGTRGGWHPPPLHSNHIPVEIHPSSYTHKRA